MLFLVVALFGGLLVWLLFALRGWHGLWSLEIFFRVEDLLHASEGLWQVVLRALDKQGIVWSATPARKRQRWQIKAHNPIELPSERVRLWFDNSPSGSNPNPRIVRVAITLEPSEKGGDAPLERKLVVDSLRAEEHRQRAELPATKKA